MGTISTAVTFTTAYTKTDGNGDSYTQQANRYADSVSLSENVGVRDFTLAAGATGTDILPANFSAGDHIIVTAKMETTNSDANLGEWEINRTDSGAVVHEMRSKGLPVGFGMESGDTALTADNLDGTNAVVLTVSIYRHA